MLRSLATLLLLTALCCATAGAQPLDLGPRPPVQIDCLAVSDAAGQLSVDPSLDGSWRQFRRDRALSGRSPLIGDIDCPDVLWHLDFPQLGTWLSVLPGAGPASISLPTTVLGEVIGEPEFDYFRYGDLLDLDGDGYGETEPTNQDYKISDFLPAMPGLERVTCYDPNIGGGDPVPCRLENFANGSWQNIWTSDPLPEVQPGTLSVEGGRPIVGDFDDDGDRELAVIAWYEMYVLDFDTGTHEQTGTFFSGPSGPDDATTPRGYGFFGAFDVDQNGTSEFVILGDRERFISVFGLVDGELEELWKHKIEAGTGNNATRHVPLARPVVDVDGDGLPEIVTRIYNENDDGLWHTVVFDAVTGNIDLDLPGTYIQGLADVDGDGVSELFLIDTIGLGIPEFGDIAIVSFDQQQQATLWSHTQARFAIHSLPYPPDHINSNAVLEEQRGHRKDVFAQPGLIAGNPVFAVNHDAPGEVDSRLALYQIQGGQATELGSVTGPRLELLSIDHDNPQQGILVLSVTEDGSEGPLAVTDLAVDVLGSFRLTASDGAPAANLSLKAGVAVTRPSLLPLIVTQRFDEILVGYQVQNGMPVKMWERPARGMADGQTADAYVSLDEYASVLLANVAGDERLEIIAATEGPDGQARMTALRRDGTPIWESAFNVPGRAPPDQEPGITNWAAGHVRSSSYEDVVVHYRVSESGAFVRLLDGNTGNEVWERAIAKQVGDAASGCLIRSGGLQAPLFDWDGDQLDEVVDVKPSLVVYDGPDGADVFSEWINQYCPDPLPPFDNIGVTAFNSAAAEFLGSGGGHQLMIGKNRDTLVIMQTDGTSLWNTPLGDGMPITSLQGIGDVNGNGMLDVVAVGRCVGDTTEATAYDGATGTVLWSHPYLDACDDRPTSVATGDINGDGRDEALFTSGNTVYAIGEVAAGVPAVLWTAEINPGNTNMHGQIQIADVTGTGHPQILISAEGGYVFSLGVEHAQLPTFADVPFDYWAWPMIERLSRSGVTAGCGNGNYCPADQVTRAQMAVFLQRGINGSGFVPPAATGQVFNDVAEGDFAASFIEQLAADGITAGCGNGNYCPDAEVTRDQMAVFLLRAKHGSGYSPPSAIGVFSDVPANYWAAAWIEQLSAEGITSGCGGGDYCPEDPVTRDQMAVFLVRTFGL